MPTSGILILVGARGPGAVVHGDAPRLDEELLLLPHAMQQIGAVDTELVPALRRHHELQMHLALAAARGEEEPRADVVDVAVRRIELVQGAQVLFAVQRDGHDPAQLHRNGRRRSTRDEKNQNREESHGEPRFRGTERRRRRPRPEE